MSCGCNKKRQPSCDNNMSRVTRITIDNGLSAIPCVRKIYCNSQTSPCNNHGSKDDYECNENRDCKENSCKKNHDSRCKRKRNCRTGCNWGFNTGSGGFCGW